MVISFLQTGEGGDQPARQPSRQPSRGAGGGAGGGRGSNREVDNDAIDIEAPVDAQQTDLDDFFNQVAKIKGLLAEVRTHHNALEDAHERSKMVTRSSEMHALRGQMQDEANTISRAADQIKRLLQELERSNEAALKKKASGPGTSSERTRTAVTAALKKKLKELMAEFQGLRGRVQREYREVVERRVYTVTGQHASEEQIDHLIEAGEGETVFQKAILEQGRGHVMDTLAEIRERRDAVQELEASLQELHQIFLDMAVLVEAQGEMVDNIEAQVSSKFPTCFFPLHCVSPP